MTLAELKEKIAVAKKRYEELKKAEAEKAKTEETSENK